MSNFQHHTRTELYSKCNIVLVSSLNWSPIWRGKEYSSPSSPSPPPPSSPFSTSPYSPSSFSWILLLLWQSHISFHVYTLHHLFSCYPNSWNIPDSPGIFDILICIGDVCLSEYETFKAIDCIVTEGGIGVAQSIYGYPSRRAKTFICKEYRVP